MDKFKEGQNDSPIDRLRLVNRRRMIGESQAHDWRIENGYTLSR